MTRYRQTSKFHGATFEEIPDKKPKGPDWNGITWFALILFVLLLLSKC